MRPHLSDVMAEDQPNDRPQSRPITQIIDYCENTMKSDRPSQPLESVPRIEPARLENSPERVADLAAELSAASARFGRSLHARTSANIAALVRIMNTYFSNLIEGHDAKPRDIERALAGELTATRAAAIYRSRRPRTYAFRRKSIQWLVWPRFPSQRPRVSFSGCIGNPIEELPRRC